MSNYQAFETLREHKARLHGSVLLGTGVELAARSNCNDRVTQESATTTIPEPVRRRRL